MPSSRTGQLPPSFNDMVSLDSMSTMRLPSYRENYLARYRPYGRYTYHKKFDVVHEQAPGIDDTCFRSSLPESMASPPSQTNGPTPFQNHTLAPAQELAATPSQSSSAPAHEAVAASGNPRVCIVFMQALATRAYRVYGALFTLDEVMEETA